MLIFLFTHVDFYFGLVNEKSGDTNNVITAIAWYHGK